MSIVLRRWRPLAALAAAVVALVLVPQGTGAGALPLTPVGTGPNPIVRWVAVANGASVGEFQQCTGFGSRSPVIQATNGGTGAVTKAPGPPVYPDVTCTRGITGTDALYAWRSTIELGTPDDRSLVLSGLDATGTSQQVWDLLRAWPSQYIQAFDRVVVVFTHDRDALQP